MAEWYRKDSWGKSDEEDFFLRLNRAKDKPQYLKIQALTLIATQKKELLDIAEMLLLKLFQEFPEDKFNKASSYEAIGNIYRLKGNADKALVFYKNALEFEAVYPNVLTNAFLEYSELIVKQELAEHYAYARSILSERLSSEIFPITQYKGHSLLAIINYRLGNHEGALQHQQLAEVYASKDTSGLRYHQSLGIVEKRESWLDRLTKLIC